MNAATCETCGHQFPSANARKGHRAGCWPGNPNPPKQRSRQTCQVCTLSHTPRCQPPVAELSWPTAPLVRLVGGPAALARLLGWSEQRSIQPFVGDVAADHLATRCRLHPEVVWPGWIEAGLTERDRRFVNEGGWRQAWLWWERLREAAAEVAA